MECHAGLADLSISCPPLKGRLPMHYSPVCHSTCPPKRTFAFDLHVLGTPPAFTLSQDQTLQFDLYSFYCLLCCTVRIKFPLGSPRCCHRVSRLGLMLAVCSDLNTHNSLYSDFKDPDLLRRRRTCCFSSPRFFYLAATRVSIQHFFLLSTPKIFFFFF